MQTVYQTLLFILLPVFATAQQSDSLPNWQIGAGASFGVGSRLTLKESDYEYPDIDYLIIPNYTLGLHLARRIAPDVWLDASVQYARKGYRWIYHNYNGANQELCYTFDYIDFVLRADFRMARPKNLFLCIGPALHFNFDSEGRSLYKNLFGSALTDTKTGPPEGFRPFAVGMAGGAGFCPAIGKGWRLRSEILLRQMVLPVFDRAHPPSYFWSACIGIALLKTL